jgi:hypothetical protein
MSIVEPEIDLICKLNSHFVGRTFHIEQLLTFYSSDTPAHHPAAHHLRFLLPPRQAVHFRLPQARLPATLLLLRLPQAATLHRLRRAAIRLRLHPRRVALSLQHPQAQPVAIPLLHQARQAAILLLLHRQRAAIPLLHQARQAAILLLRRQRAAILFLPQARPAAILLLRQARQAVTLLRPRAQRVVTQRLLHPRLVVLARATATATAIPAQVQALRHQPTACPTPPRQ